ncbi:MAG: hypothetical protein QN122_12470 [Armatimonadota bacterium]|nr:hypothetical protein [Armatimonadota bacterium]
MEQRVLFLRNLPPQLQEAVVEEARRLNVSRQEAVRRILGEALGVKVASPWRRRHPTKAATITVSVPEALYMRVLTLAAKERTSRQALVVRALNDYFARRAAA